MGADLRQQIEPARGLSAGSIDGRAIAQALCARANGDLERGQFDLALRGFELAARYDAHSATARAGQGVAFSALRRVAEARAVFDHARLVDVVDISSVPGWPNIEYFNRQLAAHILARPDLRFGREGVATERGWQTRDLLNHGSELVDDSAPPTTMRALAEVVLAEFESYLGRKGKMLECGRYFERPVLALELRRADAVVLPMGGRQRAHVHDFGWCSAVYYVAVPSPAPRRDIGWGLDGKLCFGKREGRIQTPDSLLVSPRAGRLVLFPSYLFHSTIRFRGPQLRISVAFDLQPPPSAVQWTWGARRVGR